MARHLFTSESVTEGHPDKICDQISDAVLDAIFEQDPNGRVACETCASTGLIHIMGEITTSCYVDIPKIARQVVLDIGYDRSQYGFDGNTCAVITNIDEQSGDIALGVDKSYEAKAKGESELDNGAGDQGMMFGYATSETPLYIPVTLALSHALLMKLADIRRKGDLMPYLRPDSKSQVTVEYDETGRPRRIDTIVVSTQHDEFVDAAAEGISQEEADRRMLDTIYRDVRDILIPLTRKELPTDVDALFDGDFKLYVNPTGKFVIGGPHGDTGLTGRKIIVDTYGGRGAHGGGAFSGKDSSKVDRSAAYAARHIAKNLVAAGVADEVLVELSYAIGIAQPLSIYVDTYRSPRPAALEGMTDGEIARRIGKLFDLRPAAIVRRFGLKNPIFEATASYGHFGNRPYTERVKVWENGRETEREIEFFGWEKLDAVELIRKEFGL